jgi:hypothetical protein
LNLVFKMTSDLCNIQDIQGLHYNKKEPLFNLSKFYTTILKLFVVSRYPRNEVGSHLFYCGP